MERREACESPMVHVETVRRIFSLLKPYKFKQAITLVAMVASIVLSLLLPLVLRFLIDEVLGKQRADMLVPLVLFTLGIFIAQGLFHFLTSYLFNVIGQSIVLDLRTRLFAHLMKLPVGFLSSQGTGRIMARVLNDVSTIGGVVSTILLDFLIHSCKLIAIFAIMFHFHWRLTVLAFVSVPFYALLIRFFNARIRSTSYQTMVRHAEVSSAVQEALSGIREIRCFNMEHSEQKRFLNRLRDFFNVRIRLAVLSNASIQLGFIISSIGILLVLWYGGSLVLRGALSLGTLIAFWAYIGQLYSPINVLMNVNVQFQETSAALKRIDEILSVKPAITEKPDAKSLKEVKGMIEFRNVTFSYDGKKPVVENLSFTIHPGETVAIVGRSGSGKTTIANLIVRFYDPLKGLVLLDNHNVADLKIRSLRDNVALVSQDTFLFNATIEDNIRFGQEDASEEEVRRAAEIAGVLDYAETLPKGLKTLVGERGVYLSGGERQRIALARAILRNPAVLVLDEATSQLDSQTEKKLRRTLEQVMQGRTSIMISHRLSTVSGVERILVLEGGRIAEEGSHETLMQKRGIYYLLYEEQAKLAEGRPT